eukprot:scaffold229392_cov32-Prasinocladus_malaysianus.AAC.1
MAGAQQLIWIDAWKRGSHGLVLRARWLNWWDIKPLAVSVLLSLNYMTMLIETAADDSQHYEKPQMHVGGYISREESIAIRGLDAFLIRSSLPSWPCRASAWTSCGRRHPGGPHDRRPSSPARGCSCICPAARPHPGCPPGSTAARTPSPRPARPRPSPPARGPSAARPPARVGSIPPSAPLRRGPSPSRLRTCPEALSRPPRRHPAAGLAAPGGRARGTPPE